MTAAKAALIGPHNMGSNPSMGWMHARPFRRLLEALPCGTGWSGRPTLGAPPCSSFPPPENHPGMCATTRARQGWPGMASKFSTRGCARGFLTVAKFSCPGPPRRANPRRWHDRANLDDQSFPLSVCGARPLRFFFFFPGCRLGHLVTWTVADYRWFSYRERSAWIAWLLGWEWRGNRRELGDWALKRAAGYGTLISEFRPTRKWKSPPGKNAGSSLAMPMGKVVPFCSLSRVWQNHPCWVALT
ncbi:uncharacterized protein B0H64DRAFT_210255 [Chaetomium fimeti]|uniref:Uncharacterized protein n=1 Tax=Chaetomium fimeti TaxID=1854472 RepID=A0AAE0HB49_9PEZI|nr:hypothetical protein B0H64DRAFT_210255 [Chaetomium fimeti]